MSVNVEVRSYGHLIDGEERDGGGFIDRPSPATGEPVARFADGGADDVAAAVAAARAAFDDPAVWSQRPAAERARVLLDAAAAVRDSAEHLARIDAEEVGKPIRMARGDVEGVVAHFEFAAGLAPQVHGDSFDNLGPQYLGVVSREPVGVAALIVPWNFPALIFSQKVPYALAAGCTAVVKPSELTSGSALEIGRILLDAGLPPGVLNVVTGYGHSVGQALVSSPEVDFISFTGSTATGRRVAEAAAQNATRTSLELGSKAANVVFADAAIDDAVDGALFAVFFNSGECCVSGARLLVEDSIADEFVARLKERAERLVVAGPDDERAEVGAMIHEGHAEKVLGYVDGARSAGAELVTGGERLGGAHAEGIFIAPTIFDRVRPEMAIFREEVFGPVLSVTRFSGREEAIRLANESAYGLANSVWTQDLDTAILVSRNLRSGTVWVNTTIDGGPQLPFGGVKGSGYGREMGRAGLEEFTELKTTLIRTGKRDHYYG